ncbi:hypothetical protein ABW19_dt0203260 [Dactylella cylindrospora]|nr:hypothetical protein ABW19_dt0203260 [Dactylella cylindrospora]
MEDFNLTDDKIKEGRKLMVETIEIGRLLNDENEDDVLVEVGENSYNDELNDGMNWWWEEQEEKRRREEETEPENSQASVVYVDEDE